MRLKNKLLNHNKITCEILEKGVLLRSLNFGVVDSFCVLSWLSTFTKFSAPFPTFPILLILALIIMFCSLMSSIRFCPDLELRLDRSSGILQAWENLETAVWCWVFLTLLSSFLTLSTIFFLSSSPSIIIGTCLTSGSLSSSFFSLQLSQALL